MTTKSPTVSPPASLVLAAPGLTPSAPPRVMGCFATCTCMWISRCALQCHRACRGYLQPAAILTLKAVPRIQKKILRLRKPNGSETRHLLSRLTISPTNIWSATYCCLTLTLVENLKSVVTQRCWSPRKIRKSKLNTNSSGKYYAFPPKTHDTKNGAQAKKVRCAN